MQTRSIYHICSMLATIIFITVGSQWSSLYADQYVYIPKKTVLTLKTVLYKGQTIRYYCRPCGSTNIRTIKINSIGFRNTPYTEYQKLFINDRQFDLAYLYIRHEKDWINLAVYSGLFPHSVTRKLSDTEIIPVPEVFTVKMCDYAPYIQKGERAEHTGNFYKAKKYYYRAWKCNNTVHVTNYKLALIYEKTGQWEQAGDAWMFNTRFWQNDKYASARAAFAYKKSGSPQARSKCLKAISLTLQIISGSGNSKRLHRQSEKIYTVLKKDTMFSGFTASLYKNSIRLSNGIMYRVRYRDTLVKIASAYNIPHWKQIYYHNKNREYRQLRPDPSLIFPGDRIFLPVPGKQPRFENKQLIHPGSKSKPVFQLKSEKIIVRISIKKEYSGKTVKKYRLKTGTEIITRVIEKGDKTTVRNFNNGIIQEEIDPSNSTAELSVWTDRNKKKPDLNFIIRIGHLPPLSTLAGKQVRLHSLGFKCKQDMGAYRDATKSAVKQFQEKYGMVPDGWPGYETSRVLEKMYSQ